MFKKLNLFAAAALSLLALSASSELEAKRCERDLPCVCDTRVTAAQAIYQLETIVTPVVDARISFPVKDFKSNVIVDATSSIFEVKIPGLYSLDAFLLLSTPTPGDLEVGAPVLVGGYITINDRKLLPFFNSEVVLSSLTEFHFTDRYVYLNQGDRVSVILSSFPTGITIESAGFSMFAINNSYPVSVE